MMSIETIVQRLKGAAKNGVVWGASWFALSFAAMLGMRTAGVVVPADIGVLDMIAMAARIGIVGGVAGGAFAGFISWVYQGRRLSEISPAGFGLRGAAVAVLFLLVLFTAGNLATGDALPALDDILGDLVMAAVFGGLSAAASMWLAQHAGTRPLGGPDRHAGLYAGAAPAGAEPLTYRAPVRARP